MTKGTIKRSANEAGPGAPAQCDAIRKNLLTYFGQETTVLVGLHHALLDLSWQS